MKQDREGVSAARRRGIQSVEIGLRVLESVSALGRPSTLTAISQACDMAAPQVHRYLQSLIATGMARQDPESGRYDLGPAALKLGLAALARTDAYKLVDNRIRDFVDRSGQTVLVAALGPLGPTIVRWYAGSPGVTTSLAVGSVLSLLHSATGRVFLCFAPRAETKPLATRDTRRSPLSKSELDEICRQVHAEGRAHVSGTIIPGLNATAFPVFDLQGRPILCATLLWPEAFDEGVQAKAADELGSVCRRISNELGWIATEPE